MRIRIRIQFWIQGFDDMKFLYFFLFLWVIFALLDPDLATQMNANPDPQPWYTPKGMDRKRESFVRERLHQAEGQGRRLGLVCFNNYLRYVFVTAGGMQ
jgi:hypothetical protein